MHTTAEQDRALATLVEQGRLTAGQADEVRTALWGGAQSRVTDANPAALILEVAGYVGGGLMLGGSILLASLSRSLLGRTDEAWILAGIAAAMIVGGFLVAPGLRGIDAVRRERSSPRRRLVAVLFAFACVPALMAANLALDPAREAGLVGAAVGLVVAASAYATLPSTPGQLATAGMSAFALFRYLGWTDLHSAAAFAVAFIGLGLLWTTFALVGAAPSRAAGLAIGATFAILGSQIALGIHPRAWGYALTLAAAAGCFRLYWTERATVLLAAGVIATTLAVPEGILDATNGTLRGPTILLIAGGVLTGASAFGVRLRGARIADAPGVDVPSPPRATQD